MGDLKKFNASAWHGAAVVALAVAWSVPAHAQLTGGSVVAGKAIISQPSATSTLIKQLTPNAIINWNGFSIPRGDSVVFQQLSSSAIALNRVLGGNPSLLLGSLSANGQVWLINPAGIVVGRGGSISAAGVLLSTADIHNADFLAGNYNFDIPGNSGAGILNHGAITTSDGGTVVLAGAHVTNDGLIAAELGSVVVAGASTYAVDFTGDGLLSFAITSGSAASGALVANKGTISAKGGLVLLTAQTARSVLDNVINTSGIVEATSAATVDGKIVLSASGGGTEVSGTLDASGKGAGQTGGTVEVLGDSVTLAAGAKIDVSGDAGGGTALIGGNFHGAGPEQNAATTSVAAGSIIDADAITSGNGGKVAVWSEDDTTVAGSITARGGAAGGNGGYIETSGGTLSFAGITIDASAPHGTAGTWLLDPYDLTITAAGASVLATALDSANIIVETGPFSASSAFGTVNDTTGNGDITIAAPITWSSTESLTLSAFRNIAVEASITDISPGVVTLQADNTGTGTGTVSFTGGATINTASTVSIFYNPASYSAPTNFTGDVSTPGLLTAYMLVNSFTNLQNIGASGATLSGTYALGTDIFVPAESFLTPIGTLALPFTGTFDGRGMIIENLAISSALDGTTGNIGLFGDTVGATIRNIGLVNVSINSLVVGPSLSVGALIGSALDTHVTNAYSTGAISGNAPQYTGGLVGSMDSASVVTSSYSTASISISGGNAGGLVGENGGTVTNSYATGSVFDSSVASNTEVGGLVGENDGAVENSFATGPVSGSFDAGGLVGANDGFISQSYAIGSVTATSFNDAAGGLVGVNSSFIEQSYATGFVTSSGSCDGGCYTGGLVGINAPSSTIDESYALGNVSANGTGGGLVGDNEGAITQSYEVGTVTGSGELGALIGNNAGTADSFSFWDIDNNSSPSMLSGVGTGFAGFSATGMTTAQLTAGVPNGYDLAVWAQNSDGPSGPINNDNQPGIGFPYLQWSLQTITGTTFTDRGVTPVMTPFDVFVDGVEVGAGGSPLNGTYTAQFVGAGADVLVVLAGATQANTFYDGLTGATVNGLDLYGGYLRLISGSGSYTAILGQLDSSSSNVESNPNVLFFTDGPILSLKSSGDSLELDSTGNSLVIDQSINTGTGNLGLGSFGSANTLFTQTAPITATNLLLSGPIALPFDVYPETGNYVLTDLGNEFTGLFATTQSLDVFDSGAFTIVPAVPSTLAAVVATGGLSLASATGLSLTNIVEGNTDTVTLQSAGSVSASDVIANGGGIIITANSAALGSPANGSIVADGIDTAVITFEGLIPTVESGGFVTLDVAGGGVGTITLGGDITTAQGAITLTGPTVLTLPSTTIDSTNGGADPAGAPVSFSSTLDGTAAYGQGLSIVAGTTGNVTFGGNIGGSVRLAGVAISSADAVSLAGAFTATSLTVAGPGNSAGAATFFAEGNINTVGATSSILQTVGGPIDIVTSGLVTIDGDITTTGGVNTISETGGAGGAVSIEAGGAIQIGSSLNPASNSAIFTDGFAAGSGQTAGAGGNVFLLGTSITLFAGVNSAGGAATAAGAIGLGGTAGAIDLTTSGGDVTVASTAFPATAVSLNAAGGGTTAAAVGSGNGNNITIDSPGNITVSGNTIAEGGNGGSVTIIGGGAVQLGSLQNPATNSAITSQGYNAGSGQTAGNGGDISVSGASVSIFSIVNSDGGNATAAGALGAGGTAGTIGLTATSGALTVASTGFPATPATLVANGGTSGTANGGNAGSVTLSSAGNVAITGEIVAVGGEAGDSGTSGNGGAVTVTAGGSVAIGTGETLVTRYTGNFIENLVTSILSRGGATATSTSTPGNGAPVMVSGTSITLPFGVISTGGGAEDNVTSPDGELPWVSTALIGYLGPSTANGGNGANITITGTGPVLIGNPAGSATTSTGNVAGLLSIGGSSTGGSGGNAGSISVTGSTVSVAQVGAQGGSTFAAAAGGNGGNVTLTATSAVSGAITLYGNADVPGVATPTPIFGLDASSGQIDVTAFANLSPPALLSGQGGIVTLTVPSGGTIQLATSTTHNSTTGTTTTGTTTNNSDVITAVASTSVFTVGEWISGPGIPAGTAIAAIAGTTITLTSKATASGAGVTLTPLQVPNGVNAGSTVDISASGGVNGVTETPLGGTITFNGPVEGSSANVQSLSVSAVDGTITAVSDIGGTTALNSLILGAGINTFIPGGSGGAVTLQGPVTADTQFVDFHNSGSLVTEGLVTTPSFATEGNLAGLVIIGGIDDTGIFSVPAGQTIVAGGTFTLAQFAPPGSLELSSSLTINTSASDGAVTFDNPVYDATPGGASLTITAGTGPVTIGANVGGSTPLGAVTVFSGSLVLIAPVLITDNGAITFNAPVVVNTNVTLDTNSTNTPTGGAAVTFAGTVDGSIFNDDALVILAGSVGNVTFEQRVGAEYFGVGSVGTTLGSFIVQSADNVILSMPFGANGDGFSADSFTIANGSGVGAANLTASSFISTITGASAGTVDIVTSGNVSIALTLFSAGAPGGAAANDGAQVAITAGGSIAIGASLAANPALAGDQSIEASGGSPTSATVTPGNGGNVTLIGTSIALPEGVEADAGNALVAGSAINGGNAGTITLTATAGSVTVGSVATGPNAQLSAEGGDSLGGSGGAGGSVTVSGTTLSLSGIVDSGGDTAATSGVSGGNAGAITLIATATSGAAVTLYGTSTATSPLPIIPDRVTLGADGGSIGDPNAISDDVGGTISGNGGNITIEGSLAGAALNGTAFIALTNSTATASKGGPTVVVIAEGGVGHGGQILFNGPVQATTSNVESLFVDANNGTTVFAGAVGSIVPPNTLAIGIPAGAAAPFAFEAGSTGGVVTFEQPVTVATQFVDQRTNGTLIFDGLLTTPNFTMAAGTTTLELLGGSDFTGTETFSGGAIGIEGLITTDGVPETFSSPIVLEGATTIDTTDDGSSPSGAAVTFDSTLDGASTFADNLTINAGAGAVTFDGRVGRDNVGIGTALGAVTITTTGAVTLAVAPGANDDGFSAGSITMMNVASLTAASYLNTRGASSPTLETNGGPIDIDTTGNVAVGGGINSGGGVNSSTGVGGDGGAITINAEGSVAIGTAITLTMSGSGASLVSTDASVFSGGFDATASGQTPGNGAPINIIGSSIDLPLGIYARGGHNDVAGSAAAGGNGASITLNATSGGVTVGIPTGANATGNLAIVETAGGNSPEGAGGSGAAVTITGQTITLGKVMSSGGESGAASGIAENGGNISLIATAASGAAVTLYGDADAPGTTSISFVTLDSRGGIYGATEVVPTDYTGGTVTGAGGNITIAGGVGDAPLNGTSFVQLATSTATALNGGSTVALVASGAPGQGGTITVLGPVEATTANVENLTLRANNGTAIFTGAVGDLVALNTLTIGTSSATTTGVSAVTFDEPVTTDAAIIDLRTAGSLVFGGPVMTGSLTMLPGITSLALLDGGQFTGPESFSGGPVTAAGTFVAAGSDPEFALTGALTLAGPTTFNTAAVNGQIALGTVDGAFPLTLAAGSGGVTLNGAIGGSVQPISLTVTGGTIAIDASVTTAGSQIYTGAVTIGGAGATLSGGSLTVNGTIDGPGALTMDDGLPTPDVIVTGAIGATVPLASFTVNGMTIELNSVSTVGSQSYTDSQLVLDGTDYQTDGASFTETGSTTVNAASPETVTIATTGSGTPSAPPDITFASPGSINASTPGVAVALDLDAGSGGAVSFGAVSGSLAVAVTSEAATAPPVNTSVSVPPVANTSLTSTTSPPPTTTTTTTTPPPSSTSAPPAASTGPASSPTDTSGGTTPGLTSVTNLDTGSSDFASITGTTGDSGGTAPEPVTVIAPITPATQPVPVPVTADTSIGGPGSHLFVHKNDLPHTPGVPGITDSWPTFGNRGLWFASLLS